MFSCEIHNWKSQTTPCIHCAEPSFYIDRNIYPCSHCKKPAEQLEELRKFVKDCAMNWDCDSDGHKNNTGCRKCDAERLLNDVMEMNGASQEKFNSSTSAKYKSSLK